MVSAHDTDIRSPAVTVSSGTLKLWVRGVLLVIATGLIALFVVAARLAPYDSQGRPLTLGAHQQLGMPPCQFLQLFGRPCPTCGMTTSFALLAHGDLVGSFNANFAGTMLAIALAILTPWTAWSGLRGRWLLVRAAEWWLLIGVVGTVGLALLRWFVVVGVPWLFGYG